MLQMWGHFILSDMVISGSALFLMDLRCFMKFRIQGTQPSVEMHPCREFPASQDAFRRLEIIPARHFLLTRMHFPTGNHPSQTFPANQDDFPHWKSSLQDISFKSGWFSPLEIIPPRHFLLIRMIFPAGNHLSQTFPSNQDDFPRWKSSLPDISF